MNVLTFDPSEQRDSYCSHPDCGQVLNPNGASICNGTAAKSVAAGLSVLRNPEAVRKAAAQDNASAPLVALAEALDAQAQKALAEALSALVKEHTAPWLEAIETR